MSMSWDKVDDANGNVNHALVDSDHPHEAFVFFRDKTGFGNNKGEVKFIENLHRMPNGNLGEGGSD